MPATRQTERTRTIIGRAVEERLRDARAELLTRQGARLVEAPPGVSATKARRLLDALGRLGGLRGELARRTCGAAFVALCRESGPRVVAWGWRRLAGLEIAIGSTGVAR